MRLYRRPESQWARWFAWRPIYDWTERCWVWLEVVETRIGWSGNCGWGEKFQRQYRVIGSRHPAIITRLLDGTATLPETTRN